MDLKALFQKKKNNQTKTKTQTQRKWKRRGEIQQEKYKQDEKILQEQKKKNADRKRRELKEIENYKKQLNKKRKEITKKKKEEETSEETSKEESKSEKIPKREIIRILRDMGEPVTLFGETDAEREKRFFELLSLVKEAGGGQTNAFQQGLKEFEKKFLEESLRENSNENTLEDSTQEIKKPETMKILIKEYENNKETFQKKQLQEKKKQSKGEESVSYFEELLEQWYIDLQRVDDEEKRSRKYKIDVATYKQCFSDIQSLFKLIHTRKVSKVILEFVCEIVELIKKNDFIEAQNTYIGLAIGNAAWPIGVTSVSSHQRTSRDKISQNKIAHVLNDETQRKYIQAVKRCITYAEKKYNMSRHKY
ncbi:pre-mRNA splicing factor-related [Anaeramoeba flamelloides]|uniref:Pre-mRNA-splicing factor 18 n=1 Tax=Anaeramoeba flamelloides TaxID=1746091 RepID=A0ABQ8YT94_9EUKA|nr:pre-mRNA splicing factor-related [Anaeramoeba flamelloides]